VVYNFGPGTKKVGEPLAKKKKKQIVLVDFTLFTGHEGPYGE
jgi:hypothetical protein